MKIIDGRKLAERILRNLRKEIKKKNLKLKLAVIQVGRDPVSEIYIREKQMACQKVGIGFKLFRFPVAIKIFELKKKIKKIVRDKTISGLVLQFPLPKNLDFKEISDIVPLEKDPDCLFEEAGGKFYIQTSLILPATLAGIIYLLKKYKIKVKGKKVVVVGAGRLVGLPVTLWLLREKATVTVVNEFTPNTPSITKTADILISGVGKPNLIRGEMVKRGVIVIDAGTSLRKGKLVGDLDFKSVSKKASYITPVPGGVGPMTVACLLENLVKLNSTNSH